MRLRAFIVWPTAGGLLNACGVAAANNEVPQASAVDLATDLFGQRPAVISETPLSRKTIGSRNTGGCG